jgi:hypothetical protein
MPQSSWAAQPYPIILVCGPLADSPIIIWANAPITLRGPFNLPQSYGPLPDSPTIFCGPPLPASFSLVHCPPFTIGLSEVPTSGPKPQSYSLVHHPPFPIRPSVVPTSGPKPQSYSLMHHPPFPIGPSEVPMSGPKPQSYFWRCRLGPLSIRWPSPNHLLSSGPMPQSSLCSR